ncbi:hypothetical protein Vi05172_g11833 [Venturia inaequalis]|nr:hypothetical protein Vi05172_g11833 [Venturia inaequalis]
MEHFEDLVAANNVVRYLKTAARAVEIGILVLEYPVILEEVSLCCSNG